MLYDAGQIIATIEHDAVDLLVKNLGLPLPHREPALKAVRRLTYDEPNAAHPTPVDVLRRMGLLGREVRLEPVEGAARVTLSRRSGDDKVFDIRDSGKFHDERDYWSNSVAAFLGRNEDPAEPPERR